MTNRCLDIRSLLMTVVMYSARNDCDVNQHAKTSDVFSRMGYRNAVISFGMNLSVVK